MNDPAQLLLSRCCAGLQSEALLWLTGQASSERVPKAEHPWTLFIDAPGMPGPGLPGCSHVQKRILEKPAPTLPLGSTRY